MEKSEQKKKASSSFLYYFFFSFSQHCGDWVNIIKALRNIVTTVHCYLGSQASAHHLSTQESCIECDLVQVIRVMIQDK